MNTTRNMTTTIAVVSYTIWTIMMSHDLQIDCTMTKHFMTASKMLKSPFTQPLRSFIHFRNVSVARRYFSLNWSNRFLSVFALSWLPLIDRLSNNSMVGISMVGIRNEQKQFAIESPIRTRPINANIPTYSHNMD